MRRGTSSNAFAAGNLLSIAKPFAGRKDGALIDVSLTISPIKDAKGKVVGVSKIARDISGRKKAERELQMAKEELAQVNRDLERRVEERTVSLKSAVDQLEEFSYTVSHDLRTPLRGMAIHSTALMEAYPQSLPPEAVYHLKRIAENAVVLDKMILDVLTFSRAARQELRLGRVSLSRVVEGVAEQLRVIEPRPVIQIDPLLDVIAHEASLTQAISNLLGNAAKFVPPGIAPRIRVWTEGRGAEVRLWWKTMGSAFPHNTNTACSACLNEFIPISNTRATASGWRSSAKRRNGWAAQSAWNPTA